jgi:hypothetical protein
MRNFLRMSSLVSLFAVALALFPPTLHAQWVYVNDNQQAFDTNTAWGFKNIPTNKLLPIVGTPWATGGTSFSGTDASRDQALYTLGANPCLFISEPLASTGFPNGDIAAFTVNTGTGVLTFVNRFASPAGNSGTTNGIGLATGNGTLYAGYTTSNTIQAWHINAATCDLLPVHAPLAVFPLHGGFIDGMAESHDYRTLVVAYRDGSIESFKTVGSVIAKTPCPTAINSTGFTDGNGGMPSGVDITEDSKYAILGDVTGPSPTHGVTELETVLLPITCARVTTDYGGGITASGTSLGSFIDSTNVWLSPNESFIYVTNNGPNSPEGFTTVGYAEPAITGLAGPCILPFSNPTSLRSPNSGGFFEPNGIQTSTTAGTGTRVYVAEYGNPSPSAVALLKVNAAGCTKEAAGSPFADPSILGGNQLNAWPPRLF